MSCFYAGINTDFDGDTLRMRARALVRKSWKNISKGTKYVENNAYL